MYLICLLKCIGIILPALGGEFDFLHMDQVGAAYLDHLDQGVEEDLGQAFLARLHHVKSLYGLNNGAFDLYSV